MRKIVEWPREFPQGFTFTFPDPQTWPAAEVENFRRATEPRSLMDVFAFRYSDQRRGSFFMEDAVLAVQLLPIRQDEWSTALGYPACTFEWWKLSGYTQTLEAAGYRVWILEPVARQTSNASDKVVSITGPRALLARRPQKWA